MTRVVKCSRMLWRASQHSGEMESVLLRDIVWPRESLEWCQR
jgi:hypothetical protein